MTNRIGGPGPSEPTRGRGGPSEPDSKKFDEKMKKVEKVKEVDETDLDKQKKRSFFMTTDDLTGDLEKTETKAPSPFERDFMQPRSRSAPAFRQQERGFEDLLNEAIPSPPSTQTPQINSPVSKVSSEPESSLPQSDRFWEDFDMPDQTPPPSRVFQESRTQPSWDNERDAISRPEDREERREGAAEKKKKKQEESVAFATGEKKQPEQSSKKKEEDEGMLKGPIAAPGFEEGKKEKKSSKEPGKKDSAILMDDQLEEPRAADESSLESPPFPTAPREEKKDKKKDEAAILISKKDKAPSSEERSPAPPEILPMKNKQEEDEKPYMATPDLPEAKTLNGKEEGEEKKEQTEAVSSIALPSSFPVQIEQTVQTAQTAVASYLNPTTAALFHQMVGAILFLAPTTPGISRTEIVLNSQNMLNSPFYNSKILLEKYASAPDSFNVRLTGTPQAVKLFSDNMQAMTSAFTAAYQEQKLRFRIGRIETAIASERPLIRRKKEAGSQDDAGERGG